MELILQFSLTVVLATVLAFSPFEILLSAGNGDFSLCVVQATTKSTLKSVLEKQTSDTIQKFICKDFNGDGKNEAVAITSKSKDDLGYSDAKVWYITKAKCTLLADCSGWALYPHTVKTYKVKGTRLFTFDIGAGGSGVMVYAYAFDKSGAREVDNVGSDSITYLGKNKFIIYDSRFDAFKDGSGHTWNAYYSKWDGKELVEYGGLEITQSQLKNAKNGAKILKQIKKKGTIGKIYYRANNLISVNYTTSDANYNVTLKLKNGKVSYYAQGQSGKISLAKATEPGIIYPSITSCVKYSKKFPL
jgi:hypothetical protein